MRQETAYNKLVARKDDDYYFCDYIFKNDENFKGATGSILRPISKDEHEYNTSEEGLLEYLGELWQDAVASGNTEMGKAEWCEWVYEIDGDNAIYDLSYHNLHEQLREIGISEEDFPVIVCSGGGRCFNADDEFDEVYDQELLDKIRAIETKNVVTV